MRELSGFAIGMPFAPALGVLASLAELIPVVGGLFGAIPALIIALSEGEATVLWVILLYFVVQQVEGNVLTPLMNSATVHLPPALTLFSIVAGGVVFGPLGIFLGAPLAVVVMVGVNELYLKDPEGRAAEG